MKYLALLFFILFLFWNFSNAQSVFAGNWRGIAQFSNQTLEASDVIYLSFSNEEKSGGLVRLEINNTKDFSVKSFDFSLDGTSAILEEKFIRSSSNSKLAPKCKLIFELKYNEEKAFLEGVFKSSDCRNVSGKVVLYRAEQAVNMEKEPVLTHYWKHQFVSNYANGLPAPEVLDRERNNFKFHPIFFDHDESEIKPEFHDYLNQLARLLHGIHDLRLEVTGHTDAVGTDEYNIGLSERRAKAIMDFFLKLGIEKEKLEIDFKGKRMPIDTNKTPEGKQRNRRVDFRFI